MTLLISSTTVHYFKNTCDTTTGAGQADVVAAFEPSHRSTSPLGMLLWHGSPTLKVMHSVVSFVSEVKTYRDKRKDCS